MNLKEEYTKETGKDHEHFGGYSDDYVEWLESRLQQPKEVSEEYLIKPKDIADRLLRLGYKGVLNGIADNTREVQKLLWHNSEVSDGQDAEQTAEKIADLITDIAMILDQA